MLECQLPKKGSMSGMIVKHAFATLDKTLAQHGPMVFKIGFTHCPHSRLRNPVFGYLGELQKWERMVIVFASSEAVGPAFLEAALIQKYKGCLHYNKGSLLSVSLRLVGKQLSEFIVL